MEPKKAAVVGLLLVLVIGSLWLGLSWFLPSALPSVPGSSPTPVPTPSPVPSPDNDLIVLDSPQANDTITSPVTLTGKARGQWFFEASFPVVLTNWDGLIIAEGVATAEGEWMTEDFVPFTATLEFETPEYSPRGAVILQKANASGLPENDDALEVPIFFGQ